MKTFFKLVIVNKPITSKNFTIQHSQIQQQRNAGFWWEGRGEREPIKRNCN